MTDDHPAAAEEIDAIVANAIGWRGPLLAELRAIVLSADADMVEAIKWRKPSKPEGVATWVLDGNVCMADLLKNAVRLTFPKGAAVADPDHLFNARTDSGTVRAIDVTEGAHVDGDALRRLVQRAVVLNRGD